VIRHRPLIGLVAGVTALASCGSAGPNAATVNGSEISRSDFEDDLDALSGLRGLINPLTAENGSYSGEAVRFWLGIQIEDELKRQAIADAGEAVTDEDLATAEEQLSGGFGSDWEDAPEAARVALTNIVATDIAFGRAISLDREEVQATYESRPADTGTLCLSHILVESEDDALAVLDELDAGADFAELAAERSTEPAAAETGGVLADQDGSPCIPLTTLQSSYDPQFVAGALEALPGTPTEPVESSFGWHVILARPFEEVGDDVVNDASATGRPARIEELRDSADITTDPRYGRWDPEVGGVVAG
jgi:hypothetical protein